MERNKIIIIALLVVIAALLVGIFVSMPNLEKADAETTDNSTVNQENTASLQTGNSAAPDTITVDLQEFDKEYTGTAGEYTMVAQKWMGGSVGGFDVNLYKNGERVDKDSYLTRAYFYKDGEWKWSDWGNGEDGYEMYHRYPVSRGVEIQTVEVKF